MQKLKLELNFPGKLKNEPILCLLCKEYDITLSILEASFSTDTGWAIVTVEGKDTEIKKMLEYLKNRGVEFQNSQK
jgi:ABC-type methionine transport system ATPase subunit